jgi:hypothetical protein
MDKVLDKADLEGRVPGLYSLSAGSQLDLFCLDEADEISQIRRCDLFIGKHGYTDTSDE